MIILVADNLTREARSRLMASVKSKDTQPEQQVRRLLWSRGYRYRLHAEDVPGCPDIAFRSRRKVIFVHGCFWHRHTGCNATRTPKTRRRFWKDKFDTNKQRDRTVQDELEKQGWAFLVIWECETKDVAHLTARLTKFMEGEE